MERLIFVCSKYEKKFRYISLILHSVTRLNTHSRMFWCCILTIFWMYVIRESGLKWLCDLTFLFFFFGACMYVCVYLLPFKSISILHWFTSTGYWTFCMQDLYWSITLGQSALTLIKCYPNYLYWKMNTKRNTKIGSHFPHSIFLAEQISD